MKKMVNTVHAEGYLYKHDLKKKVAGEKAKNPGAAFIQGSIDIATNEDCSNIVTFYFTYETPQRASGATNKNYALLADIADGKIGSVMGNGKENAAKISVDSALALNDFCDSKTGEPVSIKRNEGGFVNLINELNASENERTSFKADMIITGTKEIEADEEKDLPRKLILKGHIFNFRGEILPVEFAVLNENAMNYFASLEASATNPCFTQVSGRQVSLIYKTVKTEESAFGEDLVTETERSRKDYVVTWARKELYDWDDEGTILATEVTQALANRQVKLAEVKQRNEEYLKTKNSTPKPAATVAIPGGFNF